MYKYFKAKEKLKKIFNYFSIFTIVFGTTLGTLNTSAYAADVGTGATHSSATATAYDFNTAAKDLTINTSVVMTVNVGAITDTAITGDVIIVTANNAAGGGADAADATITIASITMDAGTTPGVVTITDADDEAGTLTVNVTGDLITDGTLTITTAENTDDELLTVDVAGTVNIAGATEINAGGTGVTGDIAVNLSGASITFTGGVDLADISTTGASTLTFDGSVAQTVTGAIDGDAAAEGILNITNASGVTFASAIGGDFALDVIDVTSSTSTATFSEAVVTTTGTITGTATFAKTITATNLNIETTGDATFTGRIIETSSASSELDLAGAASVTVGFGHATSASSNVIDIVDMSSTSSLIVADTVTDGMVVFHTTNIDAGDVASGAKIYMPVNLSNGQTLKLFGDTDAGGDVDDAVNAALQDNSLITYAAVEASQIVTVTASEASQSSVESSLSITANNAKALSQAYASAISDSSADASAEDAFGNALNALGGYSSTEDTALAKQVAPQDDMISGSTVATRAMTGTVQGIMSSRMASLRSGDAYFGTGMSAGAMMSANSGFIQAFGSEAEQKNKTVGSGTQFGYDSSSSGLAIGFDGINDNGTVVGLSLSMSNTDVDGKGTGKAKNDIDSYTASIYMDKATDSGYIEGSLTVGLNENNSSRLVNTAGLSRTYKGSYDSQQVSLKIGGGVPNSVGNNGYVTPFGSITGTIIETDAYTETSTTSGDNLRLRVAQDDVNSVVGTIGVKYHNVMSNGGVPMISLAINNEFGDDTINSTNTYQGGGTSFTTSTAVEELSATLGLGFSMGNDVSSVEFAYEANVNDDDYLGHYGSFKIVTKF